jgi:hypothetical protein
MLPRVMSASSPVTSRPEPTPRRGRLWPWVIALGAPLVLVVSLSALRSGSASRADGENAVALIERARDGACWVGGSREHCYRLEFLVFPKARRNFRASVDVNVPDRFASRIEPGSYVWVVRSADDGAEVKLALDAFEDPAPQAPEHPEP